MTKKVVLIHPFNFTHKNIKILYRDFNLNIVKLGSINSLQQIHCTMTTCLSFFFFLNSVLISFNLSSFSHQGTMHLKLCIVITWYSAIHLRDVTAFHAIHIPISNLILHQTLIRSQVLKCSKKDTQYDIQTWIILVTQTSKLKRINVFLHKHI